MAVLTVADLITKIRRRADIQNQTAFISDDEVIDIINEARQRLWSKIALSQTQDLLPRGRHSFITNATDSTYDVASDILRITSVDCLLSNNNTQTISARPYMERERNAFKWLNIWTWGYPCWYRMVGKSRVTFIPNPGASYTAVLNYVPECRDLVSTDAVEDIAGWQPWLIWTGVSHCKSKGDEDSSYAMAQAQACETDILALASARDTNGPERVVDAMITDLGISGDLWP